MGQTALLPFRRKACWEFFSPWKVRRLRPGLNPRTWVPKASRLPLDHRSHYSVCIWLQYRNGMSNWNILFTTSKLTRWIRADCAFRICMPCARRIQNILLFTPFFVPTLNEISFSRHTFLRKVFFNLRANLIRKTESIESIVPYQSGRWHCSKVQSSQ